SKSMTSSSFRLAGQRYSVFMWCCMGDIGAHHACWLLLQAAFMTASAATLLCRTLNTSVMFPGKLKRQLNLVPVESGIKQNRRVISELIGAKENLSCVFKSTKTG